MSKALFFMMIFGSVWYGILSMELSKVPSKTSIEYIINAIKKRNSYPLFRYLSHNSAENVCFKDELGNTVLHYCAPYGNQTYLFKKFAEKKVDFNASNLNNETPLLIAIKNGNITGALILLKYGVSPGSALNKFFLNLFFESFENVQILNKVYNEMLLRPTDKNAKKLVTEAFNLIKYGQSFSHNKDKVMNFQEIPKLVELAARVVGRLEEEVLKNIFLNDTYDWNFLLSELCKNNVFIAIKRLKSLGDKNLCKIVRNKILEHQKYIAQLTINACDKEGNTPLMYAAKNHARLSLIKFLMEQNASPYQQDKNGKYPYELVMQEKDECKFNHENLGVIVEELKQPIDLLKYLNEQISI